MLAKAYIVDNHDDIRRFSGLLNLAFEYELVIRSTGRRWTWAPYLMSPDNDSTVIKALSQSVGRWVLQSGAGGGGGGSFTPQSACLQRRTYDPGTEIIAGPTTFGGSYGITGGSGTYPGASRNAQDWDTVVWASPGMVDLVANPRRINILEDGIYGINGIIEFETVSTENILSLFKNGYDTVGSHTGTQAANDGLEPNAGGFINQFGFTAGLTTYLLQNYVVVPLLAGDFVFLGHQCDVAYRLLTFNNPAYLDNVPQFSVTKLCDIPA